jgi:hypothetical protein
VAKVTPVLNGERRITKWTVETQLPDKVLTVEGDIAASEVAAKVAEAGFRVLGSIDSPAELLPQPSVATYKPLLLVVSYLILITLAAEVASGSGSLERAMRHFMAGFFLAFSFFKLLDLRGFANAYGSYDLIAARNSSWGYVYPFLELLLGWGFLANIAPVLCNWATLILMTVGLVGVSEALWSRRKVRCACLGTGFNLPMSVVTFIENATMILMSLWMLWGMRETG